MLVIGADTAEASPFSAVKVRSLTLALGGLLAVGTAGMLYGAWLSDDYLIGLRQTLNLVHGRGFSFFADARVQTMTSPLWGLVLAPVVWLFDAFYAPMLLSVALSLAAVVVLQRLFWKQVSGQIPFILALSLLVGSKAFIDFSSSGLENPLAHVFAALMFASYCAFSAAPTSRGFGSVCAYAALLCLTRYDYAVLVLPTLAWGGYQMRAKRQFARGLWLFLGCCVPWLAFSLIYYGTILPNAFYAKLTTGIPLTESVSFGLKYYHATWLHDPTSLVGMTLGVVLVALGPRRWQWMPITLGIVLYLGYIIPAGGDFMVGRFISVPVLWSAGLLTDGVRTLSPRHFWKVPAGLVAYVMVVRPELPLMDNYASRESMSAAGKSAEILPRINDEKKAYVFDRGLMTGHHRFAGWLAKRVELWSETPGTSPQRAVLINCGGLGWLSFEYGPEAHVYDLCALADPFLSKLPLYQVGEARRQLPWGPGHFTRSEPEGYSESVATGANALRDPVLADVFGAIQKITTGPFFTAERWRAIMRLGSLELVRAARAAPSYAGVKHPKGQETEVASYAFYSNPFRSQCTPEALADRIGPLARREVLLDAVTHSRVVKLTGTPEAKFRLTFTSGAAEVGGLDIDMPKACASGLGIAERPIPLIVSERGFDAVRIGAGGSASGARIYLGGVILDGVDVRGPSARKGKIVFDKPACQLPTLEGEMTDGCSVTARVRQVRLGHLTYGPYVPLAPGAYLFELEYRSSAAPTAAGGRWDAAVRSGTKERVLARGEIMGTANASGTLEGRFWVPRSEAKPVLEIRTSAAPDAETEIKRLRIYEVAN